jgi:predicted RNA-binding protein with RPS1 domain
VVEVGQKVRVKLLSVDEKSGKIQLSMKDAH